MLAPGQTLDDRYRLVAPLGAGGQGSVWRVEDALAPGVPRAVKLLKLAGANAADAERIRREARALHKLEHASLVHSHRIFEDLPTGMVGLVLDFVDGEPLDQVAQRMTFGQRLAVLHHIASVLAYVHQQGMAHRDVKPANVLVTRSFWANPDDPSGVKLVDFGIAAEIGRPRDLTRTGHIVGTSGFLAPEQLDSRFGASIASPAADVFALGILAWIVLTGQHPTRLPSGTTATSYGAAYSEALDRRREWPPNGLPGGLDDVIAPCLALHPTARPSARDVAARLEGAPPAQMGTATYTGVASTRAAPQRSRSSAKGLAALVGMIALLAGGGTLAMLWSRSKSSRESSCDWEEYMRACGRTNVCPGWFPADEPLDLRFAYALPKISDDERVCAKTTVGKPHCWQANMDFSTMPVKASDLGKDPLDLWIEKPNGSRVGERNMPRDNPVIQSNTLWLGLQFGSVGGETLYFYVDPPGRKKAFGRSKQAISCRRP